MNIGLTFDLREDYVREGYEQEQAAEFDDIETIVAIELALRSLGHATERIGNARSLVHRLGRGDRWNLVFNIAEGMHGFGRQALVPALLDTYGIPYIFSNPLALSVTLHKGTAKHIARDLGIPTPDFEIIEDLADLEKVTLPFPLFAKPIAEGTSKGIGRMSKVLNRSDLRSHCQHLLTRYRQPVLVETFLPGREFTVGVLGTGSSCYALGVMEILLLEQAEPDIYSYTNKIDYEGRVSSSLVADPMSAMAKQIALDVWKGLGCHDAGRVDLRCDAAGRPNFLEVNPLAGLHPKDSDLVNLGYLTGLSYVQLIERIVASALDRLGSRLPGIGSAPLDTAQDPKSPPQNRLNAAR
jgi:D-alanine-D-alanine ligase